MLYSAVERCLSGRKCRSRKAVGCKPSWVRIPLSPPGRDNAHLLNNPDSGISTEADKSAVGPDECPDYFVHLCNRASTEESHSGLVSTTGNRVR